MRKNIRISCILIVIMLLAAGCGGNADKKEEELIVEDFDALTRDDRTQVIVRDEPVTTEAETAVQETEDSAESETEMVVPYADRVAGDNGVLYNIETTVYEDGAVSVEYPQLTGMADAARQQEINEKIRKTVAENILTDNLSSYELRYETATKGNGIVSFIFRGTEYYANSAYPNNVIKTLNIDLNTGKNVRLKDFADIALVVSSLENADGYTIINEGVDAADFSAYLNNGAVTDYAITLLDYDIDFDSPEMITAGFSAIRDNHLVLFIKAEHAMGDYVELVFDKNL
ncbi:MAG: hypothetical protein K2I96_19230 [Lachnospiraceae bacterium]|nr:hypothetical protein [Lachnospiraceae bacterium]